MKNNIKNPTKSSPDEKKLKKIIDKLKELEEKTRNTDIFHQIANIRYLMELQNSPKGTVKFNAETGMPCSPINDKKQPKKGESWRKGYQAGYEEAIRELRNCLIPFMSFKQGFVSLNWLLDYLKGRKISKKK